MGNSWNKDDDLNEQSEQKSQINIEHIFLTSKKFLLRFVLAILVTISVTTTMLAIGIEGDTKGKVTNKKDIQNEILTAIKNGAPLDVVNQIYKNRNIDNNEILNLFKNKKEHYGEQIVLSEILKDIKTSLYVTGSLNDSVIVSLDKIIIEHSQVYPFDKLDNNQKDLFENISAKIPDNYEKIQNDIIKISDELYAKNLLVSQYLSRSNTSFWISIIAVGISLLIGAAQLYQNSEWRNKKLRKIQSLN